MRRGRGALVPLATVAGGLALTACGGGPQSTLQTHGPAAERIADLWWLMFYIALATGVVTLALLGWAAFRPRRDWRPPTPESDRAPTRWILIGGVAFPAVVLSVVFVFVLSTLGALASPGDAALTVEVTGKQWWWEVKYPAGDDRTGTVRTANEIHVPAGQRVELLLTSDDVIHSFWAPGLNGKMDLIPGRQNRIWIQADTPGVYRGQCAEYCGLQHTHMGFRVIAHEPAAFAEWLAHLRQPAAPPQDSLARVGQQVFLSRACVLCHAVRGTGAHATAGPDLTHLASRLTLAAGTLPNTRGHLGGWIGNPQHIKPGNHMPRVPLSAAELEALLAYLQSLD